MTDRLSGDEYDALDEWLYEWAPKLHQAFREEMIDYKGISAGIPATWKTSGWFENIEVADVLEVFENEAEGAHQLVSDAVTNCLDWAEGKFHEQDVKEWERVLLDTITSASWSIRHDVERNDPRILKSMKELLLRHKDKMIENLERELDKYFDVILTIKRGLGHTEHGRGNRCNATCDYTHFAQDGGSRLGVLRLSEKDGAQLLHRIYERVFRNLHESHQHA